MNASGANGRNARLLNSLIQPLNTAANSALNAMNSAVNSVTNTNSGPSFPQWTGILIFLLIVAAFITVMVIFKDQIEQAWKNASEVVSGYFSGSGSSAPPPPENTAQPPERTDVTNPAPQQGEAGSPETLTEKVLPGGGEVFNVASNRYSYYDAEPLCKALGAELATYDQVKEAWSKGADWCNYGWTKGQMAVYPTSDDTYQKLQAGPEEQRLACGRPGMNGGFFDNPELRFGVNCYGKKPAQGRHDENLASKGAPISPDALAFDKKVAAYKSESDHIGILPFNSNKWST
jgi:hypothetical protein